MNSLKKALCFLLCCALCLGCFPLTVFAAEGESMEEFAEIPMEEEAIEAEATEEAPAEEPAEAETEEAPAEEPAEVEETEEAPAEEPTEAEIAKTIVTFVCEDADLALLSVFAEGDREHPMEAKEPGVYELLPGEYVYTYPGMDEGKFTVGAEALTVTFALPEAEEAPAEEPAEAEEAEEAPAEEPAETEEAEEAPAEEPAEAEVTEEAPTEEPAEAEVTEEPTAEVEVTEEPTAEAEATEEIPPEEPENAEEEDEPLLAPAGFFLTSPSYVSSGNCGNGVTWSLSTGGELRVSGSGSMYNYLSPSNPGPWQLYADQVEITSLVVGEGVTSICDYAFADLPCLSSVSLPDSLTWMGHRAFASDSALTSIVIPDGIWHLSPYTFAGCSSLESVTLPSGLNAIDEGAFNSCYALSDIVLPEELTSIGYGAFYDCWALTGTVNIPISVNYIGDNAFDWAPITAFSVVDGNHYFSTDANGVLFNFSKTELVKAPEGSTMTAYTVPSTVTTIRSYGLFNLDLTSITLPAGLTAISEGMLANDPYITSIVIPDGVATIGHNAFTSIHYLKSLYIPASVSYIDSTAFNTCMALDSVTVDSNNPYYCNDGYGAVLTRDMTTLVFFPRTYTGVYVIPDTVQRIEPYAFNECKLCQVDIPTSVTYLGEYAFLACRNLHFVKLPNSISNIPAGAFACCTSLEAIYIPSSITAVTYYAFGYCSSLQRLYYQGNDAAFNQITVGWDNEALNNVSRWMNVVDAGYCGAALDWELFPDGGLVVNGHGGMFNYTQASYTPWNKYVGETLSWNFPGITSVIVESGVTTVGDYAFSTLYKLEQAILADTVTDIGAHAFSGCVSLTSVVWPANLKTIGEYAFVNAFCDTDNPVSIIRLPDGLETIGGGAFVDCYALESIIIPDSVTEIGGSCFYGCDRLSYIRLSENVKDLDGTMFAYTVMESIRIPASVTHLHERAFLGCQNLTEILVDEDNETYRTIDGCVYTKDGRKLVIVPEGKEYVFVVPEGVTEIGDYAFEACDKLTDIILPDSLTKIGYFAFSWCYGLYTLAIPGSVTTIAVGAFPTDYYGKLQDIWFYGTETMWNQIEPDPNGFNYASHTREEMMNELVGNATVHFVPTLAKPVMTLKNTASGVNVDWNDVPNADNYYIIRFQGDDLVTAGNATRPGFTDTTAVEGQSYLYEILAEGSGFIGKYSNMEAIVCVKSLDKPVLNAPENTASGVKLTWNAVENAAAYRVGRKGPGESSFKLLEIVEDTSYVDTTAVNGNTYTYMLRAANGDVQSDYSTKSFKCVKSLAKPTVNAPENTASGVKLTWSAVANAANYRVGRKGPGESSYKLLATPTGTSYTDTTAVNGTTYTYMVRAANGSVQSGYNTGKSILCVKSLAKPTLNAPENTTSGVKLSWSAVENAAAYRVGRKGPGESSYQLLEIITDTTYVDTTAVNGSSYSYMVRAVNGSTQSSYVTKSIVCVRSLAKPVLNAPENTTSGVKLTWSAVSNAKSYRVGRKTNGTGSYKLLDTVTGTSYTDTTAEPGNTYAYIVRAVNGSVIGSYNAGKSIVCVKSLTKPTLNTPENTASGVKLSWNAVNNATGYRVGRKGPDDSSYKLLEIVTGTTYTDTSAVNGTTYSYMVRAVNGSVQSGYNTKSIKCVKSLTKPTVNAPTVAAGSVTLSWSAVTNATNYRIGRKGPGETTYKLIATPTGTSYTDTDVVKGSSYTYIVRAANGSVQSGYNTGKTVTAK